MFKRFFVLLCLLWIAGLTLAQDDFSEEYVFVDGTIVNFPSDFLTIYEDYDEMHLANDRIEIQFYITYERTLLSRELETLPDVLNWWWDDTSIYKIGEEEAITIGEREGIQFTYENSDGIDVRMILIPVGNGSVAVVSIIPEDNELEDDSLVFSIIDSLHAEDSGTSFDTILGNIITFDDNWVIEHTDDWLTDTVGQTLSREEVTLSMAVYSSTEIEALELKDDPIELLYYDLFAPVDGTIEFDPESISFINIRGLEGIRYALLDTINEENVQRVYFLASLNDEDILALEITAPVGTNILQNEDIQDMIQTIRPEGSLPPIEMMSFDNAFNLQGVGEMRFPAYWRARDNDDDTVTLSTVDIYVFIVPFDATYSLEEGYPDDLASALLAIVSPLDESVILNPDDVETGTLENGNAFAETTYIETNDSRSYPRTVKVILLEDNAMVFVGYSPQPGVEELSEVNQNEVRVILNTIAP